MAVAAAAAHVPGPAPDHAPVPGPALGGPVPAPSAPVPSPAARSAPSLARVNGPSAALTPTEQESEQLAGFR